MCRYKVLHHNDSGYVVQCSQCDHIQMAFGNLVMVQSREEFYRLRKAVSNCADQCRSAPFPECRNIQLPTPAANMMMVFSASEIARINELLQQAGLALDLNEILLHQ